MTNIGSSCSQIITVTLPPQLSPIPQLSTSYAETELDHDNLGFIYLILVKVVLDCFISFDAAH